VFLADSGVAAGPEAGCSSGGYKRRTQQKAGRTATIFTARYPVLYGTFMTFLAPLGIRLSVSVRTRIRSGLAVQLVGVFLADGRAAAGTEAGCSSGGYKRRTQQKAGRTATIFTARYPVLYGTFMTFLAPLGILFSVSIRTRIRSGLAVQLSQGQGRQPLAF
jgi:hypothetical protein